MSRDSKESRSTTSQQRRSGHVGNFGLTQEQTHVVPAVWRRRRERQRLRERAARNQER